MLFVTCLRVCNSYECVRVYIHECEYVCVRSSPFMYACLTLWKIHFMTERACVLVCVYTCVTYACEYVCAHSSPFMHACLTLWKIHFMTERACVLVCVYM